MTGTFKLLPLLLLAGCSSLSHHEFYGFRPHELAVVAAALKQPYARAPRNVTVELSNDLAEGQLADACVLCSPCHIRLSPKVPPEQLEFVLWHEYGHCFGFGHEPHGIMYPTPVNLTDLEKAIFLFRLEGRR